AQLAQRSLKDVGIEVELKIQEYGAYMATTAKGKFEGMAFGPVSNAWEPDSVLYGLYAPDQPRNYGHVNDPQITAMLKEQRRTQDREARKKIIFDLQRYIAEQQYYVYLYCLVVLSRSIHTGSGMVSYEPKMAKFLRKDARMTTVVAPSLSISPRVQLTARQRACLEQIARRQTSPQRLVRRATVLFVLPAGATQCHVMRQLHLN